MYLVPLIEYVTHFWKYNSKKYQTFWKKGQMGVIRIWYPVSEEFPILPLAPTLGQGSKYTAYL